MDRLSFYVVLAMLWLGCLAAIAVVIQNDEHAKFSMGLISVLIIIVAIVTTPLFFQ